MWRKTGAAAVAAAALALAVPAAGLAASAPPCVTVQCQLLAGLADLRGTVQELVPAGGPATSLTAKVDAAAAAVSAGRLAVAANQLGALVNEVTAPGPKAVLGNSVSDTVGTVAKALEVAIKAAI